MDPRERLGQAFAHSRGRKTMPRWVWWMIVAFPTLFILIGLGFLADSIVFVSDAQGTQGQVVDVRRSYSDDGGVSYTPTIRYRRSDGRIFEAETNMASSSYNYDIGERVEILYAFEEPEEVRIDTFFSLYGIGLIFIAMGGLFVTILSFARKRLLRRSGSVLRRLEQAAAEKWTQEADNATQTAPEAEPATSRPPDEYHPRKSGPNRTPTIRRMR
jgi:Protein of unknown function (DUF3592)